MKKGRRAFEFARESYFTVDARSLGLFRIFFGLLLIANLYDRTNGSDAIAFYTNDGVLPNHFALYAPMGDHLWSLLFPFSRPFEVQLAFALILLVYVSYVLGYHTKRAQVLVVVCLLSLTQRNLILQNGGIAVTNLIAVWTAFLPLGARFSVDHLRRSLAEHPEASASELSLREAMVRSPQKYARVAFFGILVNFACIYFFNYAHKRGATWRGGSAVHWVLWQNRINTIWAAWLRMHEPTWLSPVATRATLVIEAAIPVLLLSPIGQKWSRRAAILAIWGLHAGISLMMTLGPFSYSMMSFSLLLIGPSDWDFALRAVAWKKPKLVVIYDGSSVWHRRAARLIARLDGRRALEFQDSRDSASPSSGVRARPPEQMGACPFVLFDAPRARFQTGSAGARTVLSALPLGFLYAWVPRIFGLRREVFRVLETSSGPARSAAAKAPVFAETEAARFYTSVKRVAGEIAAGVLFATLAVQLLADNWAIPDRYRVKRRPLFMSEIVSYLRLPQGWSMFSPDAPKEDGTIVIDALLSDGRHVDPRKQLPPDFDAPLHGPWFDDQQWCDWDLRMKFEGNRYLYPSFRDYISRLDRLESWKQSATIAYFEVYWVSNAAPPPGSTKPYDIQKRLLFTGGAKP